MRPYYITMFMYMMTFLVGLGCVISSVVLGFLKSDVIVPAVLGSVGGVTILGFYITGPAKTLEQHIQHVTFLGVFCDSILTDSSSDENNILSNLSRSCISQKDISNVIQRLEKISKLKDSFSKN